MTTTRLKASIITPTFNAIGFIEACIHQVVDQGDAVLEHIIADGGSTDGTIEKITELTIRFPHVRYVPGPDRGQSDAMNKASAIARGDALGILNADDYYEPNAVARGMHHLSMMSKPGMVVGDCQIVDTNDRLVQWNRPKDMRLESLLCDSFLLPFPANPSAYFYHREVHDLVDGYDVDDHYAMDADFVLKCLARVDVRYVPEHWGNFRLIPGAKTHDDPLGPQRRAAIIERHKATLTEAQRARMRRILRMRRFTAYLGERLRRAGLRP